MSLGYISMWDNERQEPQLTALYFQGAVLFVQGVPPQVHHAGRCCGDSGSTEKEEGDGALD